MKEEIKEEIKEDLKEVLLMGLGAVSLTGDKAKELKSELLERGKELYGAGQIKNEELKHTLKEKLKDNVTVIYESKSSKEDIIEAIKNMSDEEKKEIKKYLNVKNEQK